MTMTQICTRGGMLALLGILFATAGCQASDVEQDLAMTPISCDMQLDDSYAQGAEVVVSFSLGNHSESEFEVLQYHTPLEDLIGPVFEVHFGSELLSYLGPMVKRGPPADEDWLQLKPAAVLSNELDISRAWDLGKKGQYSLSLSGDVSYRATGSTDVLSFAAANCPTIFFSVD